MRLCKRVAVSLAVSGAVFLGGLPGLGTGEAARSPELLALSPSICLALLMKDNTPIPLDCYSMNLPLSLQSVAALANPDSAPPLKPDDFAAIDLDANQMHNKDGQLFILAFVKSDEPVTFKTSAGMFDSTALWGDEGREWVCDSQDEDCDGDGVRDDGVVVAWLWPCADGNPAAGTCPQTSNLGPGTVTVSQGNRTASLDFTVVGEPRRVEVVTAENAIQTGLDADTCPLETTTSGFADALPLPEKTVILARAFDKEGTAVAGAFIDWKTDDRRRGIVADSPTPTLDMGNLGIVTANVLCGTDETGSVTVTAGTVPLTARLDGSLCYESGECPFELDPMAEISHKHVQFTVRGPPANLKIALEPGNLVCDGAASSTVSVAVTDAEGNPVVNGNEVHFDIKALGVAMPRTAKTVDGVAVATVTPLSGVLQGVPVVVTAGDMEEPVLLRCEGANSSAPESPSPQLPSRAESAPPSAEILPPSTGSGGWGG